MSECLFLLFHSYVNLMMCPVKGGAWLRRFDDVTGVEKSCVEKE